MTTLAIDKQKINRICRDTMLNFQGSTVHPLEMMLGLGEAVGRLINQVDCSDLAKKEMLDLVIQHIARTIDAGRNQIITQ